MQRHPFDARRSDRDPFPCFATAMAMAASDSDHDSDSDNASGSGSSSDCHAESPRIVAGRCACDGATSDGDGRCTCEWERLPPPAATTTTTTTSSLDWSIDGLATLLPRAFSPLAFQTTHGRVTRHRLRRRRRWSTGTTASLEEDEHDEETPLRSATFFEDEAQFGVLRTPADVIEREQQQQNTNMAVGVAAMGEYATTTWRSASTTESTARWRELHRRCVDTIQVCEARVRERQQRLARLPIPATKLALRHRSSNKRYGPGSCSSASLPRSSGGTGTGTGTGSRAERIRLPREPLTPVVPTRLSFGSIDLSPIPQDSAHKTSLSIHDTDEPRTPTTRPDATTHASGTSTSASAFSSPALSSIAEHASNVLTPSFASLQFSPSRELDTSAQTEEDEENKENASSASASSSLQTVSLLRDSPPVGASSSSSSSPSFASPCSPLSTGGDRHEAESIAARQLSFIAAIEEEAQGRDETDHRYQRRKPPPPPEGSSTTTEDGATMTASNASSSSSHSRTPLLTKCPPPATSVASIYKEARALGLTEPTAQWEYVQLIRRQTARERTTATTTSRVSF